MILSELKKQVDFLCGTGHGDNPVLVTLSESSVGSRAATGITEIHSGFDWEHVELKEQMIQSACVKSLKSKKVANVIVDYL